MKGNMGEGKGKVLKDMLQQKEGVNKSRRPGIPAQEHAKCSPAISQARLQQEDKKCGIRMTDFSGQLNYLENAAVGFTDLIKLWKELEIGT